MDVCLIKVPYDSGHRDRRMGLGPQHLIEAGAVARLEAAGARVQRRRVDSDDDFPMEVGTSFRLYSALADEVSSSRAAGAFPLILAGNCGTTLGVAAGVGMQGLGVVWFDGHGDFETPETTTSGFLDGMGLAVLTGHCWQGLAAGIPGFTPLPEERVVLVGARDLGGEERRALTASPMTLVTAEAVRANGGAVAMVTAVDALAAKVSRVHLHIDLDVHDPAEAPANRYLPADGPSAQAVREAVSAVAARIPVASASLTAYDPSADPDGKACAVALMLMETLVSQLSQQRSEASR